MKWWMVATIAAGMLLGCKEKEEPEPYQNPCGGPIHYITGGRLGFFLTKDSVSCHPQDSLFYKNIEICVLNREINMMQKWLYMSGLCELHVAHTMLLREEDTYLPVLIKYDDTWQDTLHLYFFDKTHPCMDKRFSHFKYKNKYHVRKYSAFVPDESSVFDSLARGINILKIK